MNKKIAVIISFFTILSITLAIMLSPKIENTENEIQDDINDDKTKSEFQAYINSTNELKHDTTYYIEKIKPDLYKTFDILNNETDKLLNALFDNKKIDVDEKVNLIRQEEENIFTKIDVAISNFKSDEYINALKSIRKYLQLQNQVIYQVVDIYKEEKSVTYDRFTGLLHKTHGDISPDEINYINFLSGVDMYADGKN